MQFETTAFEGLLILQPNLYIDERGSFSESFRLDILELALDHEVDFVQDNETYSEFGVIRGLHYQAAPFSQSKLVRVVQGKVWDVVVDLRVHSKTFKKGFGIELSAENKKQLFVPRGFAHGYSTLSKSSLFQYKVDNYYNKESEHSIKFDDSSLAIDWQLPKDSWIVSEKDKRNPPLNKAVVFDSKVSLYA